MALPGFSAEMSLGGATGHHHMSAELHGSSTRGHVDPQLKVCTPCVNVGGSPYCVNILGKRLCLPALGRWRGCCRTRFGIPPVTCGISRC